MIAKRKAGEYLAQLERNEHKFNQYNADTKLGNSTSEYKEALDTSGVSYQDAGRWMQLASVPENQFNEYIEDTKQAGKEITTSAVVKLAKELSRQDIEVKTSPAKNTVNLYEGNMEDVLPLLGKYDAVITDPPYNVTPHEWDKIGTRNEFISQVEQWITTIKEHLNDKYTLFWFCSPSYAADIELIFRNLQMPIQSRLIWHRRNMAKGSDAKYKFIDSWEMIFHVSNRELNLPREWDDKRFDVQTFAVPQTNFNDTKYHPTQKPQALMDWLVSYGTFDGDKILDPFAGSGTTADTVSNRHFDLIEREPEYIIVIKKRFGI